MDLNQNVGKIIQHPKYGRLYRSGDFGRLMPDGSLAFTGRKDDQVKIRGLRIELGEINNIMLQAPEVHDCVTMVIGGNGELSERLVCFWTSPNGASGSWENPKPEPSILSKLYSRLETVLPAYMIPSALIPVSYLPPTPQGKVDKRSLISHYHTLDSKFLASVAQTPVSSTDHLWTDLELEIREALAKLTKLAAEKLSPETSFFNIGVDSISAISFARNLRQTTKRQVEISDILKYSSILRLAERILSITHATFSQTESVDDEVTSFGFDQNFMESTRKDFELAGKSVQIILPCTPLQEAMLSAAESSSQNMYSNHVVFKVTGDVERMQECWQQLVQRHEVLRTCFVHTDIPRYAYAQVVLDQHDLKFEVIRGTSREAISIIEKRQQPGISFDPPYTLDLVEATDSTSLIISMHHALYDGVALSVLYEEFENLFHNKPLPAAVSFAPFLQKMASIDLNQADEFWDSVLGGYSPIALKRIKYSKLDSSSTENITHIRAPYFLSWVESHVMKHSTTLLAVCHAVWASLISERVQEADICFGNVVSGRTLPIDGLERLVAPCFNTIPSRVQNVHKLSYLEAFRRLQILNADSLPYQLTPLRRLQARFSTDGSRLFDSLFILQQPSKDLDASIWTILEDEGAMDFPLVCEVVPKHSEDSLEIILHSHSSIIPIKDAENIGKAFIHNLKAALENPRRQLLSPAVKENIEAKLVERETNVPESVIVSSSSYSLSPKELELRDVICKFTSISPEKINRDISIFRLGLDSISTVQVAAQLRRLGNRVTVSDILEHPTIAQMSAYLASKQDGIILESREYDFATFDTTYRNSICSKYTLKPTSVEAIRPCTTVQQGMIAQSLHSNGEDYVNSIWLELMPEASLSNFKAAWKTALGRHEMLRTGFVQTDDPIHPFAMVTYASYGFHMPWYESESQDYKVSIIKQLAQCPWSLNVQNYGTNSIIRFTAHHALYDAQSLQMMLSDVARSYNSQALVVQQPINSLLGTILIDTEDVESHKSYWKTEESKIIVNRFPDLTPLRISEFICQAREIVSHASIYQLEDDCRQRGVTMQAAGQAAWARLLTAYIGEISTTFGMTLSGRSVHEDADSVSFPSIVTLPVRCEVTGTNEELLARTLKSNASLHKHQFTPLTIIQKWGGFPEGRIFDTLFTYQKLPESEGDIIKLPWKMIREEASVDYAVSLEMQPTAAGNLTLRLTFRESLIPVEHASLILRQFDAILLDTLRNPKQACDTAPAIQPNLLSITPAKENALPNTVALLHQFVERGSLQWPNKTAFEFATRLEHDRLESRAWTYQQLNQEANRVANLLLKHHATPGQIVAICFDKCPEASFAIVGILKAGCTYVALDPTAPSERLKFIVVDSGAKLVLTAGKPAEKMASMELKVLEIDMPSTLQDCSSEPPILSRNIQSHDTSYCLYTSGTTGTPKGCLITHESAVQAMLSFQRLFAGHWTASSKWLQFASFHFDVSVLELFWSWSVGICVASAPRDLIFEDIPGAIQVLGITHIDLTPSLARLLRPEDVPTLCKGVFITGGEQLKQEILDAWGEKGCIYNGYG
jgi:non-ribosomal peptide synthetase component F/aryl carrier-like protein